jgi:NAD(P)-dependent dehydrogenase (short-subunit alcohol dehydrogenase family)
MSKSSYNGWVAYTQSKNADVMLALELARRLSGTDVTVNAAFRARARVARDLRRIRG